MREGFRPDTLRIPVITGPTAVGKTEISVRIAERRDCEIISADSRQIYRELEIGTAKPTAEQRTRVRHHFVDEKSIASPFSAGRFAADATDRIKDIVRRGRKPLVVGGSTLYLFALQNGLAPTPAIPAIVRLHLQERLENEGGARLFSELQEVDPAAAVGLDPTKTQRLIRALEVYHATGKPLSDYHAEGDQSPFDFTTVVLTHERQHIYERIDARAKAMVERGLIDEVERILAEGFSPSLNALQTIGYRESVAYLSGEITREEVPELIARNTRRYAKRQLTWFRRFPSYRWMHADETIETIESALFDLSH